MNAADFTPLPGAYQGAFPFAVGGTSFTYPADYVPNARMLGPYLDQLELLLLESHGLPSEETIAQLAQVRQETGLGYNIHLPYDLSLTDPGAQKGAARALQRAVALTRPLEPATYTLHLAYGQSEQSQAAIQKWRENAKAGLDRFLEIGIDSRAVSVETLDYPLQWAADLIADFDLSVCLDIGHLFLYGLDPFELVDCLGERIAIWHLHGVREHKAHLALDALSPVQWQTAFTLLKAFTGIVSLEVFSYDHLKRSLQFLQTRFAEPDP